MITVQSRILDAVEERLKLMTEANGYSFTIQKYTRATLKPFNEEDLPAANYWPGVDSLITRGAGWVERELVLVVEYYTKTRDRTFTDVSYELALDVGVALARSPAAPRPTDEPDLKLGGLIRSAQMQTATPQIGEGQAPWCGVAMSYSLSYRVSASDPSTLVP